MICLSERGAVSQERRLTVNGRIADSSSAEFDVSRMEGHIVVLSGAAQQDVLKIFETRLLTQFV